MKRILFVDDEQQILDGLRDVLRKQRHVWDMVFCVGGPRALEEMAIEPFDVIVADMRMPGMDGAQLLTQVRANYPGTVRIVLSGQADRDAVMRMLPVSQQFLSKPCPTETMRAIIGRACELSDLLRDTAIRALVGDVDTLPSAPKTYLRLNSALAYPGSGVAKVAEIVEEDPALSAKLLQIVNSAYFGFSSPVSLVSVAALFLGIELIKALALHVGIRSHTPSVAGLSVEALQREALLVAQLARRIVTDQSRRDEAFTVGVLHDIGKLVLATRVPTEYGEVLQTASESGRAIHEVELERFGASHAGVGAFLLGTWGLPFPIVQGVACHHSLTTADCHADAVAVAVRIAEGLIEMQLQGAQDPGQFLDIVEIERLGLLPSLDVWQSEAAAIVQNVAVLP